MGGVGGGVGSHSEGRGTTQPTKSLLVAVVVWCECDVRLDWTRCGQHSALPTVQLTAIGGGWGEWGWGLHLRHVPPVLGPAPLSGQRGHTANLCQPPLDLVSLLASVCWVRQTTICHSNTYISQQSDNTSHHFMTG